MFLKRLIIFYGIVIMLVGGCVEAPRDHTMYPSDWPLVGITVPNDSTPEGFPPDFAKQFSGHGEPKGHYISRTDKSIVKTSIICFKNPGGVTAVFNHVNSKCKKNGFKLYRENLASNPSETLRGYWTHPKTYDDVFLYESSNVFVLQVIHIK